MFKSYTMELAGRTLTLEFGRYAQTGQRFQRARALWRYGACWFAPLSAAQPRPGMDFFPLSVEFEEKLYSVGKIPGGFIKREGRPTEKAILTSRLIDRPIRPLFPEGNAQRRSGSRNCSVR